MPPLKKVPGGGDAQGLTTGGGEGEGLPLWQMIILGASLLSVLICCGFFACWFTGRRNASRRGQRFLEEEVSDPWARIEGPKLRLTGPESQSCGARGRARISDAGAVPTAAIKKGKGSSNAGTPIWQRLEVSKKGDGGQDPQASCPSVAHHVGWQAERQQGGGASNLVGDEIGTSALLRPLSSRQGSWKMGESRGQLVSNKI